MPFEKVDIKKRIEEKKSTDIDFKIAYDEVKKEKEIIREITKVRKSMGLTQEEVAVRAGMKQQALSRMEREKHMPSLENLFKVLNVLNLDLQLVKKENIDTGSYVYSKYKGNASIHVNERD